MVRSPASSVRGRSARINETPGSFVCPRRPGRLRFPAWRGPEGGVQVLWPWSQTAGIPKVTGKTRCHGRAVRRRPWNWPVLMATRTIGICSRTFDPALDERNGSLQLRGVSRCHARASDCLVDASGSGARFLSPTPTRRLAVEAREHQDQGDAIAVGESINAIYCIDRSRGRFIRVHCGAQQCLAKFIKVYQTL